MAEASVQPVSTRRGRRQRFLAAVLLGAGIPLLVVQGCGSMPKERVEANLLALDKNRPVREHGLERLRIPFVLEGTEVEVEARFFRAGPGSDGAPDGAPTIVLVHGTPGSLFAWSEVVFGTDDAAGLASRFDVIALDVAGHGVTEVDLDEFSFQACADYVRAFLEALDLRRVVVVGHSYGGEFAWRAALDAPERVVGLVLMSSAGYAREADEFFPEEVEMRENSLAKIGWVINSRERVAPALQLHFAEPLDPDRLEEFFVVCENRTNWHAMIDLARDENGTREAEIPRISQPTLLLWGADDLAYPVDRVARRFDQDVGDSELALVTGSGHYPLEDHPAEVARAIADFVERRLVSAGER